MRGARGAILIEMIFALAILVGAALAISASVRGGLTTATLMRDEVRSADLASSAMARIEAGIATMRELDGPVPEWRDEAAGAAQPDVPADDSEWELKVESERSGVDGLTLVSVTAWRNPGGGAARLGVSDEGSRRASFTLRRLLLLSRRVAEDENPEDALSGGLELPTEGVGGGGE